jgi:hypothetical protein
MGMSLYNRLKRMFIPLKIRDQNFHKRMGDSRADFFYCFCIKTGPAVRQIVPGDGSDDHIA